MTKGSSVPRRFGAVAAVLAVALLAALTGCVGEAPQGATVEDGGTPTPSATAVASATPTGEDRPTREPSRYRSMVLTPEDLAGEWVPLMRLVRSEQSVSPEALDLGWSEGYVAEFGNRSSGGSLRVLEVLSVYPEENTAEALDRAYEPPAGAEEVALEVGDASRAHRAVENGTVTYTATFRKGEVLVTLALRGPVSSDGRARDVFEAAAERAAEKVEG